MNQLVTITRLGRDSTAVSRMAPASGSEFAQVKPNGKRKLIKPAPRSSVVWIPSILAIGSVPCSITARRSRLSANAPRLGRVGR